jgi:EmrB/QacA subfamily drug resistance transporter
MRKTHRPITVVALILSLFMAALEATVVSTAMPTVVGDLGGIHIYSWVFTAYLLTSTVAVPIYGKLADLYGRKPIMLFGIALFLAGSFASGVSQSMAQLIAFRAIQGLGAGAMQPMAITIVGDIFSLEERGKMQGLFGAAWGVAGLVGPMAGGVIVHYLSWHWIFFINIPFGIASAVLLVVALHESIEIKPHVLDIAGAALLTAGVTALLFATTGASLLITLGGLGVSGILFAVFAAVEKRAPEPVLPFAIFKKPVIAVSSVAGALIGGAMFATMTYVPLFVQGVLGGSPTDAGSAVTPMVIGWPLASAVAGRLIMKMGYRPLIRGGLGVTAAASIALAIFANKTGNVWVPRVATLFFGLGLGFANTALLIAVQTSVDWAQRGIVTASTMFVRTIGGALAIGVTGGVLRMALARDASIPPDAASQLLGPERGEHLDPEVVRHLGAALEDGVGTIFWISSGIACAAFFASLLFPRIALIKEGAEAAAVPPPEPGHA